jgi:sulfur relay (sulfurtransferase) DsrF/TusC family protein
VFVVEEDVSERGLEPADLIREVKPVARGDLPALLDGYDQVWHW